MHKKVIHLSDIVLCNGKTIKPDMFSDHPGQSNTHKLPHQHPTPADLSLWRRALRKVSSEFLVLTVPLQDYVGTPHDLSWWMLNDNGLILHNVIKCGNREYHKVYTPKSNPFTHTTRSDQQFISDVIMGTSNFHKYASVTPLQPVHVLLQSSISMFVPPPPVSGFEHMMRHFSNQTLWVSLGYSGDGFLVLYRMIAQSLVIIHDGSYMKKTSPDICSAEMMIYFTIAKARCKCKWTKRLSSAGPYWEILGRVMTQLILNAAASAHHGAIPPVVVDCDNNGVISHGNAPLHSLPTNQTQANVLHTFKHLVPAQPFHFIFKYVQSHANETKKWHNCTLKERINIKGNRLAKKALKAAHSTG